MANSTDLRRVAALPRRGLELDGTERADAIIDMMTERFSRGDVRCKCATLNPERHANDGCITRLRLVQALALREISIAGGLLGLIGTGHGKTLVDLLAPLAFGAYGLTNFVILVPPHLIEQLIGDYEYIGQHFKMPQLVVHGTSYLNTCVRMGNVVSLERDAPCAHVVSYSRLSLPKSTDWLANHLKPQAFIADECHKLRNLKGSGANRVERYMEDHPDTRFAGWSGSVTSRSLNDAVHLAKWALGNGSPLPHDTENAMDWDRAVGPKGDPDYAGALLAFCEPGEKVVDGFRRRMEETVGVVTTSTPAVNCAITLTQREAPPIPDEVDLALRMIRGEVAGTPGPQRPDGEQLLDSLSVQRCALQAACGFYYKWIFPDCEFPRDTELVERVLEARKNWMCEVRQRLKYMSEHLDSPRLVQNAAERHWGDRPRTKDLPTWESECYVPWRDTRGLVRWETQTVWIDDFLARDVAQEALRTPQIIWSEHGAFAEKVHELSGLPIFGGGKEAKVNLLGDVARGIKGEDGSRSVVLSVKAFHIGTNGLQWNFNRAGYASAPSSPDVWEQSLARIHRPGQNAGVVDNWYYGHTLECRNNLESALSASGYIQGAWGNAQKINAALGR